jgi:ABC-type nickel/cobalt efflux system permease component RcnA
MTSSHDHSHDHSRGHDHHEHSHPHSHAPDPRLASSGYTAHWSLLGLSGMERLVGALLLIALICASVFLVMDI